MNRPPHPPPPERRAAPRQEPLTPLVNLFFALLRWVEREVRGFYAALGLYLSVGFVLALLAAWGFAGLASEVVEGETQRFDNGVLLWLNARASPRLDVAALEITSLGSGTVVWLVVIIASAFLWSSRHRYSVLLLWVAVAGGGVLNLVLKGAFDRPRPALFPWRTPYAGQSSFPSGHAMTSVVVYWTLAYLITRLEPTPLLRRLSWGFFAAIILLIGVSRLYLGVHYPSDVAAGLVVGFAWATFCAAGIRAVQHFRARKPGVHRQEHDLGAEEERAAGARA